MKTNVSIALIGERDDAGNPAHPAISNALEMAGDAVGVRVMQEWIRTDAIADESALTSFDGIWVVPGAPYRSTEGALRAIGHARRSYTPFLGTCGGFQHAVIEYAISVLEWIDAGHPEWKSISERLVISPLACGVLDGGMRVHFVQGSRIAAAYQVSSAVETYLCSYGVNPEFREALTRGAMKESAVDDDGDVRAVELTDHPFFVATLFQPERAVLRGVRPPLVEAFVRECAHRT